MHSLAIVPASYSLMGFLKRPVHKGGWASYISSLSTNPFWLNDFKSLFWLNGFESLLLLSK